MTDILIEPHVNKIVPAQSRRIQMRWRRKDHRAVPGRRNVENAGSMGRQGYSDFARTGVFERRDGLLVGEFGCHHETTSAAFENRNRDAAPHIGHRAANLPERPRTCRGSAGLAFSGGHNLSQ